MPGTFIFRPLEANLKPTGDLTNKFLDMDPYCKIKCGKHKRATQSSMGGGTHPHWNEELIMKEGKHHKCKIVVKDKNKDKKIGKVKLNLKDVEKRGQVSKWFDICKDDKVQGQLHLEILYTPEDPHDVCAHYTPIHEPIQLASTPANRESLPRSSNLFTTHGSFYKPIDVDHSGDHEQEIWRLANTGASNPNKVGTDMSHLLKTVEEFDKTVEHEHAYLKRMQPEIYEAIHPKGTQHATFKDKVEVLSHLPPPLVADNVTNKTGYHHTNPVLDLGPNNSGEIANLLKHLPAKPTTVARSYDINDLKLSETTSYKATYGAGAPHPRTHLNPYHYH